MESVQNDGVGPRRNLLDSYQSLFPRGRFSANVN